MVFNSSRLKERREGREIADDILKLKHKNSVFAIYCSCESFINSKSSVPRFNSISVYNLATGEIKSFWLYQEAEQKGYTSKCLTAQQLKAAERSMIERFFRFAKKNRFNMWIHWNMNDSLHGFDALNSRIFYLGGKPLPATIIRSQNKCDLLLLLSKLYGPNFETEELGNKIIGLVNRNKLHLESLLTREKEAFKNNSHQTIISSQNNVKAIGLIFDLAASKRLQVAAKASEVSGLNFSDVILFMADNFGKIKRVVSTVSSILSFAAFFWNLDHVKSLFKLVIQYFA